MPRPRTYRSSPQTWLCIRYRRSAGSRSDSLPPPRLDSLLNRLRHDGSTKCFSLRKPNKPISRQPGGSNEHLVLSRGKMAKHSSVVIVGAGISALAAAKKLARAGVPVEILEARERIGGRIFTRPQNSPIPIELGAEFIHGRPPEIWELLDKTGISTTEVEG